jgi:capsule biosynthesis phosphatase
MHIIIPIGGTGQRFKEENYIMPKPLINVLGKSMIYRVIDNLHIRPDDTILIVYNNQLKDFNFENLIKFYFPDKNIKFASIDCLTKGASETVLLGLNNLSVKDLDDEFLIMDCDIFYEDDIISLYKKSINKNLIFYSKNFEPNPIYSYIKIKQSDNSVSDIKEKVKISDNANTGAYGFENGYVLKNYCEKILDLNNERYISHVYTEMLNDGISVYAKEIKKFNCVGTPLQLKVYCNKNKYKSENLRICFDLDNTLVSYPKIVGDYSSVKPIIKNINFLRLLKELGHTIVIHTARRMKTHMGNIGKVTADISKVTFDTLEKFNIPCDEIYFGKPYADFYIDDLAVNPYTSLDQSLGIFNANTNPRDFNKIEYKGDKVIKNTANSGEVYWYKNIPKQVEDFFPKVYEAKENKLVLENIDGVSFSYLYINKTLRISDLENLMNQIKFLHAVSNETQDDIYSNYQSKLIQRYDDNEKLYNKFVGSKLLLIELSKKLRKYKSGKIGVIHGDPVFTNIIQTRDKLKFIDMRGKLGDNLSLHGDIYYDFAKIYQSIIGYDFILNDVEIDNVYINSFIEFFENNFTKTEFENIKIITASLLFSLIPLHDLFEDKLNKYFKLMESLIL